MIGVGWILNFQGLKFKDPEKSGVAEDFLVVVLSVLDTFVLVYISDGSGRVKTLVNYIGEAQNRWWIDVHPQKGCSRFWAIQKYDGMVGYW